MGMQGLANWAGQGLRLRARPAFTLIELLVVVTIIGILASIALPSFVSAQDRARNVKAVGGLSGVRQALELYATDHNNLLPTNAQWASNAAPNGLQQGGYLAGNRLPLSPWAAAPQTVRIEPILNPLLYTEDVEAGQSLPPPGARFSPALKGIVRSPPSIIAHFGAITSDCEGDVGPTTYVLSVIGKRNNEAIIAGSFHR